jgi:hypothetical protein
MQFTTKDLLVSVLPKPKAVGNLCFLYSVICRYPTLCAGGTVGCGGKCSFHITCAITCGPCSKFITCAACSHHITDVVGCNIMRSCGPGWSACDPTVFCPAASRDPFIIEHFEDLVSLRSELQATLKGLEAIQKEGLPSALSSKSDAEALEKSLSEALDQVRAAKKTLK